MKFQGNSDATKVPLRLVYLAALHPDSTSMLADVVFGINNLVWFYIAYLAVIAMARSDNLQMALEPWQCFLSMIQNISEGLPARYRKATLKTIIGETKHFWKVQNVSERVEKDCSGTLKLADFFCRNWVYSCVFITFCYDLAPYFYGGLPYPCHVPGNHKFLLYLIQIYASATMLTTVIGIGVTFVSICAETVVQYRLLEYEFEKLGLEEKDLLEDVPRAKIPQFTKNYRALVDHHNFLLRYCEHLRTYGNEIFVLKVIITTATMCAHLYITLQGDILLLNKIKCGVFFVGQMFDFGLYCVAAELVSSASLSAGNAIYSSNWLDRYTHEIRKAMILVLARAQKPFNFTGQGLVIVNLSTLTQVFKAALSFQAYLRTMSSEGHDD